MTFSELLALWRRERHPSTGALLEAIALKRAALVVTPALPKGTRAAVAEALCLALQREGVDQLSGRLDQLRGFSASALPHVVYPVVEVLSGLPPDPRIGTFAVEGFTTPGAPLFRSMKLARRFIACLEQHGDARHLDAVRSRWPQLQQSLEPAVTAPLEELLARRSTPAGAPLPEAQQVALLADALAEPVSPVALVAGPVEAPGPAPSDPVERVEGMTFEQLLGLWRRERHATTGQLVEDVAAKLAAQVKVAELPKGTKSDTARALLAAVRSEGPARLNGRLAQLKVFSRTTAAHVVWPLVEALEGLPADPRIATFAVDALTDRTSPFLGATKMIRRLINCVETHGDHRHFERFATRVDAYREYLDDGLVNRIDRVLRVGLEAKPAGSPLPAEVRSALLARAWSVEDGGPRSDPLADVYAAPDDLSRRQVLADVLLEQGDPRGEFISLQLANTGEKRQKQLLKQHLAAWLGRLAGVVETRAVPPVFTGGFVSEVMVRDLKQTQFLLSLDAVEWATVRTVYGGLQRLSPQMRALRRTGVISPNTVSAWARDGFPLPTLEAMEFHADPRVVAEALIEAPTPVREVSCHLRAYSATRELRLGVAGLLKLPGLRRVRLAAHSHDVVPRLLRELGFTWVPSTVQVVELAADEQVLRLERAGDAWRLTLLDAEVDAEVWRDFFFVLKDLSFVSASLELPQKHRAARAATALVAELTERLRPSEVDLQVTFGAPRLRF